ncbi:MAG: hypothetical protein ACXABO_15245 [Promethearchaeota archaeon]
MAKVNRYFHCEELNKNRRWITLSKESDESDLILDYYKNWDSSKSPVMIAVDSSNDFSENIENLDEKRLGYIRNKYRKYLG